MQKSSRTKTRHFTVLVHTGLDYKQLKNIVNLLLDSKGQRPTWPLTNNVDIKLVLELGRKASLLNIKDQRWPTMTFVIEESNTSS